MCQSYFVLLYPVTSGVSAGGCYRAWQAAMVDRRFSGLTRIDALIACLAHAAVQIASTTGSMTQHQCLTLAMLYVLATFHA